MKLFVILSIVLICLGAWAMHGVTDKPPAAPKTAAPGALRMNPELYAEAVRRNALERNKLRQKYPDAYAGLQQQTKRDLSGCIVNQVVEGVLKAVCQ